MTIAVLDSSVTASREPDPSVKEELQRRLWEAGLSNRADQIEIAESDEPARWTVQSGERQFAFHCFERRVANCRECRGGAKRNR